MAEQKAKVIVDLQDNASPALGKIQGTLSSLRNFIVGAKIFEFLRDGIVGSIEAAKEQDIALSKLDSVLKSTGGTVGLTKDEILKMNDSLSKSTGIQDEVILSGQDMLLTFKNLRGDAFEKATKAMTDMDTAMTNGNSTAESMNSTAIRLGRALDNPIAGMGTLSRVVGQFSDAEKEQITVAMESGNISEAQAVILDKLNEKFGGVAETIGNSFTGQLKKANQSLDEMKEAIGMKLMPAMSGMLNSLMIFGENMRKTFPSGGGFISDFAKIFALNFDRMIQVVEIMIVSVAGIGDVFKGIGLQGELLYLKLKNLTGDYSKEIDKKNKEIAKLNKESNDELLAIEETHKKNRERIIESYEGSAKKTIAAVKTAHIDAEEDKTAANRKEITKREKEEKKHYDDMVKSNEKAISLQEKVNREFDDGQILSIKNQIKERHLAYDDQIALMNAALEHAGLTANGQMQLEQMILDTRTKAEDERLKKVTEANSKIVDFSREMSDALASNEKDKGKAIMDIVKRQINAQIDAWAAAEIGKATAVAWGASFATFGASLAALAGQVAMITAGSAVAKGVVNSVQFHDGGIVGSGGGIGGRITDTTVRPGEQMAKLQSGEMILTKTDQVKLLGMIRGNGGGGTSSAPININVMLDRKVLGRAIYDLSKQRENGVL